jgi:hypothetical protein
MITDTLVGSLNSAFTLRKVAPRHRDVVRFLQAPLRAQHGLETRFNMANVTFDTFKKLIPALDRTSTWSDKVFALGPECVGKA